MNIVFVKVKDPIAWREPTSVFYEEDMVSLVPQVIRYGGLLIDENDVRLVIGEITIALDNPELNDFGIKFPRFRGITIIAKENIRDRQDFEIEEKKT